MHSSRHYIHDVMSSVGYCTRGQVRVCVHMIKGYRTVLLRKRIISQHMGKTNSRFGSLGSDDSACARSERSWLFWSLFVCVCDNNQFKGQPVQSGLYQCSRVICTNIINGSITSTVLGSHGIKSWWYQFFCLPSKVYARVLERSIQPVVEPQIEEEHCG